MPDEAAQPATPQECARHEEPLSPAERRLCELAMAERDRLIGQAQAGFRGALQAVADSHGVPKTPTQVADINFDTGMISWDQPT